MKRRQSIAPAIERTYIAQDDTADVVQTIHSSVTHRRGWGDAGQKYQHVLYECPACRHGEMIREVDVSPEMSDGVAYYCLNPMCKHFVADMFEAHMDRIRAVEPTVRDLGGDDDG